MLKIKITTKDSNQRLDKFLNKKLKISRSQVKKIIQAENIIINNKVAVASYILKNNDLLIESKFCDKLTSTDLKKIEPKIIHETEDYLVINKPNGLIIHPSEDSNDNQVIKNFQAKKERYYLTYWLEKKYPKIKKIGDNPIRPGIVHRLDKEVSGLMVIAKKQKSFDSLKKQFKKREVKKEYTCLVYGQVSKLKDEIIFPIKRAASGKMSAIPFLETKFLAKNANTRFEILKKFINYTLLKVVIKTGRTHQIRVHMLAYGHPVVGDNLYSTKRTRDRNKKITLPRIFLAATKLGFKDLDDVDQKFKLDLPKNLKDFLKEIK